MLEGYKASIKSVATLEGEVSWFRLKKLTGASLGEIVHFRLHKAAVCSGPSPQQPPMMFTPACFHWSANSVK